MLVASQVVFVHIPRTGGGFIKGVLREHLEVDARAPRLSTHASYDDLPVEFRDRPGFCMVRNPWDWYVSWYHHTIKQERRFERLGSDDPKGANWQALFAGGQSTFKETVTRMCEGRLEHAFARSARRRDVDLYSEYVRVLAGGALKRGELEVGRFEELIPFLIELLDRRGLLTEPLRDAVEHSPPTNAAEHGPYPDYYDQELRDLVAHKARWLTDRFDYAF
jgi:hypothetical protein